MRTIKFRAKDTETGKWLVGALVPNGKNKAYIAPFKEGFHLEEVATSTLGQFTNHLDKNGKEIYEGDIILCKGKFPYMVEWATDGFIIRGIIYGSITSIKAFLPQEREVIGNIYDNPELLKELSNENLD